MKRHIFLAVVAGALTAAVGNGTDTIHAGDSWCAGQEPSGRRNGHLGQR